jgi:hypothetical protein
MTDEIGINLDDPIFRGGTNPHIIEGGIPGGAFPMAGFSSPDKNWSSPDKGWWSTTKPELPPEAPAGELLQSELQELKEQPE